MNKFKGMKKVDKFLIFGILLSILSFYLGNQQIKLDKQYEFYKDKYEDAEYDNITLKNQIQDRKDVINSAEKEKEKLQEKIENHEP